MDELKDRLRATGWQLGKPPVPTPGVTWYAWRDLHGAALCSNNRRPPVITVAPWPAALARALEVEVRGAVGPREEWVSFTAFALPVDGFFSVLPDIEQRLRAAWEAAAADIKVTT
jgi:hypothetical protein